jgi:hypothetical protein
MKEDYLWDKTGEADPEIEHLERVLGQLRRQCTDHDLLPALENLPRRQQPRLFSKGLALAAGLAFAALALGAAMVLQRQWKMQNGSNTSVVMVNPGSPEPATAPVYTPVNRATETPKQDEETTTTTIGVPVINPRRVATPARPRGLNRSREAYTNEREQIEGMLAKEQLIRALQITSSKLDFVQKKVQGENRKVPSS